MEKDEISLSVSKHSSFSVHPLSIPGILLMLSVTCSRCKRAKERCWRGFSTEERSLSAEMSVHFSLWEKTSCSLCWHDVGDFILAGQPSGMIDLLSFLPFMKRAEARDHTSGEFPMSMWVCNRNEFLWCKAILTGAMLIMPLFTNGFGVCLLTMWDLMQQGATLEQWKISGKGK